MQLQQQLTPAEREMIISAVLGEARGEGYEGMAGVAKVIINRAVQREQPISKVLDKSQFNGAGFRGGDKASRATAEAALDAVLSGEDPAGVGLSDHFATNKTKTKWTKDYADTAVKVGGHTFYTSPKAASFAAEAQAVPAQTAGAFDALFATPTPRPSAEPVASSLLGFTGGPATVDPFSALFNDQAYDPDLPPKDLARLDLALNGRRSDIPSSGIHNKVQDLVTDMWGPNYSVSLYSGQEPEGVAPVGAKHRHPGGFAGDFQFYDPAGQKITDTAKLRDLAQGMAGRHNANIGYSADGSYMPAGNMHIDTMPLDQYQGGAQWGRTAGGEWADLLNQSREQGSMPASYYKWDQITATPEAKPSAQAFEQLLGSSGPATRPNNAPQSVEMAYSSGPSSRPVSPRDQEAASQASPAANQRVSSAFEAVMGGPSITDIGFSQLPATYGFTTQSPLDPIPTGATIPSRTVASPLETAPEAAIATNDIPRSVGKAAKQKEDKKDKMNWSPFVGAALGSLVGSPMLGAALGAAYGSGKLPSFGGLFENIPGVNVPFVTADGFNQTQWGQARNAGFVNGQYDSNRAVDAGLFAGDLSAGDWASRSALDQRDRAAAGEKTWADAFGGLFG